VRTDDAGSAAKAAAEAEKLVAPLLPLMRDASAALLRMRYARSLELHERALAAAEDLPLRAATRLPGPCFLPVLRGLCTHYVP
jgi:hypothetical protein